MAGTRKHVAKECVPVDLVDTYDGIVLLIHPNTGEVVEYCCRGLHRLMMNNEMQYARLLSSHVICEKAARLKEVPTNWECTFERPEIMGTPMLKISDYVKAYNRKKALT